MTSAQRLRILKHLRRCGSITSWEAIKEYGITRLSAVIFDLRKMGWDIPDEWEHTTNRYGEPTKFKRYYLAEEQRNKVAEIKGGDK